MYPSDEFYLKAGRDFPPVKEYDGYPQIDNGVGLVRDFLDEFKKAMKTSTFSLRKEKVAKRNGAENLILITGKSFEPILKEIAKEIEAKVENLKLRVLPVKNNLFGEKVTVTGLLSGNDIIAALKGKKADAAIIPSVTMRDGAGVFLDDLTPEDVERETGLKIIMIEPTARGLLEAL